MKHSEGEWRAVDLDTSLDTIDIMCQGLIVASIVAEDGKLTDRDRANAKLIAASPRLLRSLIRVIKDASWAADYHQAENLLTDVETAEALLKEFGVE